MTEETQRACCCRHSVIPPFDLGAAPRICSSCCLKIYLQLTPLPASAWEGVASLVKWPPHRTSKQWAGLTDSVDSGHPHKSSLSNKSAGIPDMCSPPRESLPIAT